VFALATIPFDSNLAGRIGTLELAAHPLTFRAPVLFREIAVMEVMELANDTRGWIMTFVSGIGALFTECF
jgi:hypothetical protein